MEQQRTLDKHQDRSNFNHKVDRPLHELQSQTIGLVGGAGRIGTAVAQVCLALGMKRIIISSRQSQLPNGHALRDDPRVTVVTDVERDLLPHADYVSLHAPLNDQTRGSFGRTQLERMKPTAYLINTSRGAVIREDELIECMSHGMIAGAGLDVQSSEPPGAESKLWTLDNVFLSPHIGWRRLETRQRLVDMTCDNIQAYIDATQKVAAAAAAAGGGGGGGGNVLEGCINVVSK